MDLRELFQGIFEIDLIERHVLATKNLTTGRNVYGEQLIEVAGFEYRAWNPNRSKLAAAILKGLSNMPIIQGSKVLYLGVASGTTCSHISDIIGSSGHIWGVDFAPRPLRDLIENLSRYRDNISPILGDARRPESYSAVVPKVDVIYADVAQPDQSNIVVENSELYLKIGGWAMLAIKSRSVDVTLPPQQVYRAQAEELVQHGFDLVQIIDLEPFEKDHAMAVARYRG